VDETLEPFPNWQAKHSPSDDSNEDNFTSLLRFNLSEYIGDRWSRCAGYGSQTKTTPRPFDAEDTIILYDGYCAPTCNIFSDMMKRQAGVRSSEYFLNA
jgi:hypothetical protein